MPSATPFSAKSRATHLGQARYARLRDILRVLALGLKNASYQIVDPDSVTKAVAKDRPKSAKTTFYCVRFYPAGDQ